ncbi:MAG: hypothetical protein Q9M50_03285 [Methylococcales bacterium]|nr:hypothetical protein [Methylococcales bacterium]
MKIQHLTSGLIAAMVLASPIVGAEDYPAANFQPKVIYIDADEARKSSATSSTSQSKGETSQPDSNYPAANFQPTVIYSDSDYKKSASPSSSASKSSSSSSSSETVAESSEASEDESMVTLLGLFALAAVGFVFLRKKSSSEPKKATVRARAASNNRARPQANGATGVARYLSKNMPELSSVAVYLKNKNNVQASGVSKYMAKRIVAAKAAAVAKRTGVEKYLRDRG